MRKSTTSQSIAQFQGVLQQQAALKRDILVPTKMMAMVPESPESTTSRLFIPGEGALQMSDLFQSDIATFVGYPYQFWQRSRDQHPQEWRSLVNVMLEQSTEPRMLRAYKRGPDSINSDGGTARAYLSKKYRRIDNEQVAYAALNAVSDANGYKIVASEVSETRMYIQIVTPNTRDVDVNDPVRAGITLSNSEVGQGAILAETWIEWLRCTNGAIFNESVRKNHLGAALRSDDANTFDIYRDSTKQLMDATLLAQITDVIRAATVDAELDKFVTRFKLAKERKIDGNPMKVIDVTAQRFGLNQAESNAAFEALSTQGLGLNQYALMNAITQAAWSTKDITPDRSIALERLGGQIIELSPSDWSDIASAN